ncbi:MAG: response regulator [Coprobacillus sp.]
MKVAIVDDQKEFLTIMKKRLRNLELEFLEVFSFLSVHEMNKEDIQFDLIFLDIDMPDMNGLDYAKNNRDKKIVFVTGQKEAMKKAYGPNVYGFIEKNETNAEFKETVHQVLDELSKEKYITLKIENGFQKFVMNQIIYFQYIGNRNIGFVYDCKSYVIKGISLKNIEGLLGKQFIYIDRSTLVNTTKIIGLVNKQLILRDVSTEFKITSKKAKEIRMLTK